MKKIQTKKNKIIFCLNIFFIVPLFYVNIIFSQTEGRKFRNLESALLNPLEVSELILNGAQFDKKTLPPEIGKLTNLKVLKLYGCGLDSLPKEIGELKNLEIIDLGGNYLKTLPVAFYSLINLKEVNLSRNEITFLPEGISKLTNLKHLDLSNNKLTALPMSFYNLTNLITATLEFNKIKYISPLVVFMEKIEVFNLSRNNLEKIPPEIFTLSNILYLNLYKCGAQFKVPDDLCKIPSPMQKRVVYIDQWAAPPTSLIPICPIGYGWKVIINT